MANLPPVNRKSLRSGLITESAVSENNYPMDACTESLNFNFDTIGNGTLRTGSTLLGNALTGNSLGVYEFRDSGGGTNNQIIAVNGTAAYYLSSGTWTSKRTGLTSGSKARFSTFLDYVFMVNGTEATAIWDGNPANSFVITGNAASAPTGKYIENFRARMWIAGNTTYPDRLYYSSLPSAVTTPIITWDTSVTTGQWIDISPSDGENITALHRTKVALLVFKNNHIYQVYSILQADPDPKIDVGTWSQESVVEAKNGVYFHHPTGFYRYANGGVQEISQPIIDIVNGITLANYSKVCGHLDPSGNHIQWEVGEVTYKGITYANLAVRYTISTGAWTHYSYPTQFLTSSRYNDGTTLYTVIGDNSGNYFKLDTGLTDNGTPITYSLVHAWDSIDDLRSTIKTVVRMFYEHKSGTGSKFSYQAPEFALNEWKPIGELKTLDTGFQSVNAKGRKLRFRIAGASTGQPFQVEGYEIVESFDDLVTFPTGQNG